MLTRDIMSPNPVTVAPGTTIKEAAKKMVQYNIGIVPVYDGSTIVGIMTDRDLATRAVALGIDPNEAHVEEVMTQKCVSCPEDTELSVAIDIMEKNSVRRLVVTEKNNKNKPSGIFSLDDVARKSNDVDLAGRAFIQLNRIRRIATA